MSYAVTVALANAPAAVRAGMTADVTITIDSATNVMTIPAAALRGTNGAYTVLTLGADGTPVAQPVEVGLVTNTTAEIKSGLSVGQEVVTGVNTPATGTTTTTGGFGGGFGGGGGSRSAAMAGAAPVAAGPGTSDERPDHLPRPRQPCLRHGQDAGPRALGREPRGSIPASSSRSSGRRARARPR